MVRKDPLPSWYPTLAVDSSMENELTAGKHSVADVAKATRQDKVYGKLHGAVRSCNLNKYDPNMAKFNGIFKKLYIEREVPDVATRRSTEHLAQQQSGDGGQHHVPVDAANDHARFIMSNSSTISEGIGIPKHYGRQGGRGNIVPDRGRKRTGPLFRTYKGLGLAGVNVDVTIHGSLIFVKLSRVNI